jgi:hypothetical protein
MCYVLCVSYVFVLRLVHGCILIASFMPHFSPSHHSPRLGIINRAKAPQRDISKLVVLSNKAVINYRNFFFRFLKFAMV